MSYNQSILDQGCQKSANSRTVSLSIKNEHFKKLVQIHVKRYFEHCLLFCKTPATSEQCYLDLNPSSQPYNDIQFNHKPHKPVPQIRIDVIGYLTP